MIKGSGYFKVKILIFAVMAYGRIGANSAVLIQYGLSVSVSNPGVRIPSQASNPCACHALSNGITLERSNPAEISQPMAWRHGWH